MRARLHAGVRPATMEYRRTARVLRVALRLRERGGAHVGWSAVAEGEVGGMVAFDGLGWPSTVVVPAGVSAIDPPS